MKIYIYLLTTIAFSCCNANRENCNLKGYMEIKLRPVNVSLKLPAYRIVDSLRFGKETVLSYNIKSIDSTVDAIALVSSDYDEEAVTDTNLNQRMYFQKKTVEFGRQAQKLEEKIVDIDTIKVGFLKYLINLKGKTFYEGRIFFYRGGNLVQIWLFEEHVSEQHNLHSAIDCIVQSIILE
jgi:hypothetical protein